MNYFDQVFFQKYVHDWDELHFVCHRHPLLIIDRIVVTLFLWLLLPGFLYYNNSLSIQSLAPFFYFEIYAVGLYLYLIYKIFDWYNDVWLITEQGIIDVDWNVFTRHVIYIDYHDIKGSEIASHSFWDSFFHKGDIILYTAWEDDDFVLEGAENPHDIDEHINEVIHEIAKKKKTKEKAPFDLLIHTLTEVVRDHLDWGGHGGHGHKEPADNGLSDEEQEKLHEIEKILRQKGTVDLREEKR